MALVAVVENMVVQRMRLLTHDDILTGLSLSTCLPGPISTNVVLYVGYRLRGAWGAFLSLLGVVLPSFFLVVGLAFAYFNLEQVPTINKVFLGLIPAVAAVIISTAWRMGRKEIKGWREASFTVLSALLMLTSDSVYTTLVILVFAGISGWLLFGLPHIMAEWSSRSLATNPAQLALPLQATASPKQRSPHLRLEITAVFILLLCAALAYAAPLPILENHTLLKLFTTFAGISVMMFGGAYASIPMTQAIIVNQLGWLNQQEFTAAISMVQITPGPIVLSATFIGYKVGNLLGALAATLGVFFPTALLIVTGARILERIKDSVHTQAALRGIRPAVIGMIFTAAWVVGKSAPPHWFSGAIFVAALFALVRLRVNVMWVIPAAGLAGLLMPG